jgi:hypothetical protein
MEESTDEDAPKDPRPSSVLKIAPLDSRYTWFSSAGATPHTRTRATGAAAAIANCGYRVHV